MTYWKFTFYLKFIDNLLSLFILIAFDHIDSSNEGVVSFFYFISSFLSSLINNFQFVALGGFYNRISDVDIGGSFLTTLNSFSNFGG